MRVLGLVMAGWLFFVIPVATQSGFADSEWVTRDLVPHLNWSCGSVVLGTGLVLTARHCTGDGADSYTLVTVGGRSTAYVVCRSSLETDVSTLRSGLQGIALPLRYPSDPTGEYVVVAGYPSGEFTVMVGRVLGVARGTYIPSTNTTIPLLYVISNPSGKGPGGFSGGPVFDAYRRLVGIVCCGNPTIGTLGMIPLERQVVECPL